MSDFNQFQNKRRNVTEERTKQIYTDLLIKPDAKYKAIYCGKDGHIFLETFTKYYKEISDFLIAIGEPLHRTKNIHEFVLTPYSLYAAASMNIKTSDILSILSNISKNELPRELIGNIKKNTETYGKAKLILLNNRYFIECSSEDIKKKILGISDIYKSYISIYEKKKELNTKLNTKPIENENSQKFIPTHNIQNSELSKGLQKMIEETKNDEEIDDRPSSGINYFEIDPKDIEEVKKKCIDHQYPLLEEYDFKNDILPPLDITPKFKSPTRGYQEKALGIMFSNERARSGIIVLPCGAGKTLVGILATCTIKKNTVILCNSSVSVEQWYREVKNWAIVKPESNVVRMTSKKRDKIWDMKKSGGILIGTYTMMGFTGKRSAETEQDIKSIKETEWGLMILDEVQVVPAQMFRNILTIIKSHCKLGLTATLVREDERIKDLHFLIGPKHYEANWNDLQRDGYLARVKCIEIWCEMSVDFYEEYLKAERDNRRRMRLYISNPNKFFICKALIEKHKNDKVIIFSDDLFALNCYAEELGYRQISGKVPENERNKLLDQFRDEKSGMNCLLMSKVGDTSLDLPNAKVIIQISSHFGSRRQEAQRLGRILRPKEDSTSEYNAFFYTIVTKNTEEMYFSNKRHRFLVDQGFFYKVVIDLKKELGINEVPYDPKYNEKILGLIKQNNQQYDDDERPDEDYLDEDLYNGGRMEID